MADNRTSCDGANRGREAKHPHHIPVAGWKDVLWRSYQGVNEKNLFLVAGGVTYYVLLALFPALIALVSLYGLVSSPAQVEQQVNAMSGLLPGSAQQLIGAEMHQIASASGGALSFGAVIGVLFALWTASRGMSGLMSALDIAYGQLDRRSFVWFNVIALVLTFGLLVTGVVTIALVAVLPALVTATHTGSFFKWVVLIVQWPVLIVFLMTVIAVLYRYAPDREAPQWQWASPGAATAAVLWVVGSILFSVYVTHIGDYNATYGALGGMVVLLTWLYLSAFVVVLGAEINAEMERQTRVDTTTGPPEPMGRRGAFAADTLGQSYDSD